jgi:ATP-dependent RNA helicase DDX35
MWRPGEKGPTFPPDRSDERDGGSYAVYNSLLKSSIASQRRALPIFSVRLNILAALELHSTLIIVGETGCGKTTQVPQYLDEAGWTAGGRMVACTQPRRVAAMSVAQRVAQEMGVPLGSSVGYSVQFDHMVTEGTRIKYMTDGHLVREIMADPLLARYSVIMLDEAHERSLQTDVLLGLLKKIRRRRKDLKIIIASATLDAQSFLDFFVEDKFTGIIMGLEGRQHPVDIQYLERPCVDYLEQTIQTILDIEFKEGGGDILAFLPGQEEIDAVCRAVKDRWDGEQTKRGTGNILVLPMYSQLSHKAQMRVFQPTPPHCRKIVVATNIAETSITIEGIAFVVDSGFVKVCISFMLQDIFEIWLQ